MSSLSETQRRSSEANPKVPVSKRHTARPGETKRDILARRAIPSLGEHSKLPRRTRRI
ncbi:hypothetical protein A2U01_0020558, partial [Trifolium medium]|nr:hypothetical protein [Trifolium medium]